MSTVPDSYPECGVCCQKRHGDDACCGYFERCLRHRGWVHCWHGQHLVTRVVVVTRKHQRNADLRLDREACATCIRERREDLRLWREKKK